MRIHDPRGYVSRHHAEIAAEDGSFYLTDLDSTNGTFLNGKRLKARQRVQIRAGDTIRLAEIRVEAL